MLILATTERAYDWGVLRSTNASKVKVVLEEKGLDYRVDRLKPGDLWRKPPSILEKNPLGKVPYLELPNDETGIDVIFDSTVINEYLDEQYQTDSLKPKAAGARARMRMLANFADDAFLVGYLPGLWMPYWRPPEDRDETVMAKARDALRAGPLPYLERNLEAAQKNSDYLCGAFSLADAAFMPVAMVLEVDNFTLGEFPNCAAYFDRLRARPSYRSISPKTSLADSQTGS